MIQYFTFLACPCCAQMILWLDTILIGDFFSFCCNVYDVFIYFNIHSLAMIFLCNAFLSVSVSNSDCHRSFCYYTVKSVCCFAVFLSIIFIIIGCCCSKSSSLTTTILVSILYPFLSVVKFYGGTERVKSIHVCQMPKNRISFVWTTIMYNSNKRQQQQPSPTIHDK